jgi:hypothetical protein
MATGMVSSASVPSATIRSGEKIATTPAALKSAKGKTYYHMMPGAKFVMPDGLEIIFMGGQFTTDDKEIIAELDRVADKTTSMIYTKSTAVDAVAALQNQAAADAAGTNGKTAE